jgi:hypothetical protein
MYPICQMFEEIISTPDTASLSCFIFTYCLMVIRYVGKYKHDGRLSGLSREKSRRVSDDALSSFLPSSFFLVSYFFTFLLDKVHGKFVELRHLSLKYHASITSNLHGKGKERQNPPAKTRQQLPVYLAKTHKNSSL